jgi:hypothetical protein
MKGVVGMQVRRGGVPLGSGWFESVLPGVSASAVALAVLLILASTSPQPVQAQEPGGDLGELSSSPPAVFLDCQSRRNCNQNQFMTEVEFVRWVRDRADSDIHLIFTSQGMSGGARQYTLDFVGQGPYEGLNEQLTFHEDAQDVQAEVMDGLARTMRLGLLRYALYSGMGSEIDVRFDGAAVDEAGGDLDASEADTGSELYDPWNYWTFRVSLSGDMDFRETRTSSRIDPRIDADRVTEEWKINLHARTDFRRERRELSDGREVRDDRDDWRLSALVVRSLGNHLSVGVDTDFRNSVALNQRSRLRVNPAIEYNYYPYAEATRRQMIAHYSVGFQRSDYFEETMFGATRETLPQHRLGVQYRAREEWGNAGFGVDASQFLHDADFYSLGVRGDLSYRIVRGLELSLSGSASVVNDNIHTPAGDISDEDILLGRQALPSSYRYRTSVGLSYRWGSSFANVVNTRFPGSVR